MSDGKEHRKIDKSGINLREIRAQDRKDDACEDIEAVAQIADGRLKVLSDHEKHVEIDDKAEPAIRDAKREKKNGPPLCREEFFETEMRKIAGHPEIKAVDDGDEQDQTHR